MGELKKCKVKAQDLRRLWYWVGNSSPGLNTFANLRAASKALRLIFELSSDGCDIPEIPRDVEGSFECSFSDEALWGFREAITQAIAGTNHPKKEPAPFHSIEYVILPVAKALGILDQVRMNSDMLQGLTE